MTDEDIKKNVADKFEGALKENFIKNIVMGFEIANQMIIDYINKGHTLEEVKAFCEKNVKKKDVLEKVANGKNKSWLFI